MLLLLKVCDFEVPRNATAVLQRKTDLEDCFQLPFNVFFSVCQGGMHTDGQILLVLGHSFRGKLEPQKNLN